MVTQSLPVKDAPDKVIARRLVGAEVIVAVIMPPGLTVSVEGDGPLVPMELEIDLVVALAESVIMVGNIVALEGTLSMAVQGLCFQSLTMCDL